MKKIAIAALLSSVVSGAALADKADMTFTGTAPVITPTATLAISGIGGGNLQPGTLTVAADGTFVTKNPVQFEIRTRTPADEVAGTPATTGDVVTVPVNLNYVTTTVIANAAAQSGLSPKVSVGSSLVTLQQDVFSEVQPTDQLMISSDTAIPGFDATGGEVQATVSVMVSMP